jgi:hypothetical protein
VNATPADSGNWLAHQASVSGQHEPEPGGMWCVVRGDQQLGSFRTEEMARYRFYALRRSMAGEGARIVRPDGTVVEDSIAS